MESDSNRMTVNVPTGKAVKVIDVAKEEKPLFNLIGNGEKRRGAQTEPINFIEELFNMSKPEQFVIKTIIEKVGYNNEIGEAYIPTSMFNPSELQSWKKGKQILVYKKLVGSTKQSHFMINPNAYIPQEYNKALTEWNKIYPNLHADFKL